MKYKTELDILFANSRDASDRLIPAFNNIIAGGILGFFATIVFLINSFYNIQSPYLLYGLIIGSLPFFIRGLVECFNLTHYQIKDYKKTINVNLNINLNTLIKMFNVYFKISCKEFLVNNNQIKNKFYLYYLKKLNLEEVHQILLIEHHWDENIEEYIHYLLNNQNKLSLRDLTFIENNKIISSEVFLADLSDYKTFLEKIPLLKQNIIANKVTSFF